jgi:hypothetical protein
LLRLYGYRLHDNGTTSIEGFSDAWEVHEGQQTKINAQGKEKEEGSANVHVDHPGRSMKKPA